MLQTEHKCPCNPREQGRFLPLIHCHNYLYKQDFFYICPVHLKDKGFCSPIIDEAAVAAKKKKEMEAEIERVKQEFEEKQKKKKDKEKDKDKDKDKKADEKEDKKSEDKVETSYYMHQKMELMPV